MNTSLTKQQSPEERELDKKLAELEMLENHLAELELEKTTLQTQLQSFEGKYIWSVGRLYAEIDVLDAEIAEMLADSNPGNEELKRRAQETRKTAQETAREIGLLGQHPSHDDFQPSDTLKKLYREIVRQVHPDLAESEEERTRRHRIMIEVNNAYESKDEARLLLIFQNWKTDTEIRPTDFGSRLVHAIRKIAQVTKQINLLETELDKIKGLDLYVLFKKYEAAKSEGRDLLVEMATQVQRQIIEKRESLTKLKSKREKQ